MKYYMKTGVWLFFLIGIVTFSQAQNREILFEKGSFQEVLTKARQEQKLIFMDCYTSWCGPCKLLAKNVFTQDSVADFFNTHFVNFSMDMEKGEGKALQQKYQIEAYPTLLLLDAQGEEVFRSVGGCSAQTLLSNFSNAMNPENTIPGMEKKFAAGERHPEFVSKYWNALQKGRRFEDLQKSTGEFFKGMKVRKVCEDQNWALYDRFVNIDNPLHHLMVEHIKDFKKFRGTEVMENKLYRDYDAAIMGRIPNIGHTAEQIKQYTEDIRKIGFQDDKQVFYLQAYLKIAKMKVEKQYNEYLDFMENGLSRFSQEQRTRAMMSLIMLADGTTQQKQQGNKLLIQEAQRIMQQNGGSLPAYEQQLFGFVQYKLSDKME